MTTTTTTAATITTTPPPLPPLVGTETVMSSVDITEEKYKKLKRKLREAIEVNESISKQYTQAKKKIRLLVMERNVLLECISRMGNTRTPSSSHSSEEAEELDISDALCSENQSHALLSDGEEAALNKSISVRRQQQRRRRTVPPLEKKVSRPVNPANTPSIPRQVTTVASAPPKRSKMSKAVVKTRRVQPVERDEHGNVRLPQQIGVLTVISLGKIVYDRDTFHNERYIFPVGFTVQRTYPSMIDPNKNTTVVSTITDGGDGPRFHVTAADMPDQPIIANSATGAWTVVVRRSNEIRNREHSNSASGPDYYGFKHPTIAKLIQDLPGTEKLRHYVRQNFEEMEPRAAKGVMAAAQKKRGNLEQMGNANVRADTSSIGTSGGPKSKIPRQQPLPPPVVTQQQQQSPSHPSSSFLNTTNSGMPGSSSSMIGLQPDRNVYLHSQVVPHPYDIVHNISVPVPAQPTASRDPLFDSALHSMAPADDDDEEVDKLHSDNEI